LDIGADVLVAGHTAISTVSHRYDSLALPMNEQGLDCEPIRIEDDVWIGMNVSILKGITIGQGSIIGAGSVVTKDIPANSIAVGVPAKIVGRRDAASGETFLANEARRRVA
jgi:acetyltransferase-like isoleucine patch superfamily enzyme